MKAWASLGDNIGLARFEREVDLIAIGCSAGGVETLLRILPALPDFMRQTVVVVVHLPPEPRSMLAQIFAPRCPCPVREAEDKEILSPGTIYFAPPAYHLLVERDHSFSLSTEDPVLFSRPSIDLLFESVAYSYRERALGIVLTGSSADGANGLVQLVAAGGAALVEDPETAVHKEMPTAALAAGPLAVLPAAEIGAWLAAMMVAGRMR